MAKRVINSKIEFAYVSDSIDVELKAELEKYFLFQSILVVDSHFEFGDKIAKLQQNTRCNFVVTRDIGTIKNFEAFACILAVNNHQANLIKQVSAQNNLPYIFALTNVVDGMVFKKYYYTQNAKICNCFLPLGIVFCSDMIFDCNKFCCKALLEISSLSFLMLQQKLEKLFFGKNINYNLFNEQQKLLLDMQNMLNNRAEGIGGLAKKVAKLYISYCLLCGKAELDVLDNLVYLYFRQNGTKFLLCVKYAFILVVASLQKNFFKYYTANFQDTINYSQHQKYLSCAGLNFNFEKKQIPSSKLNFLLNQFRDKLSQYVCAELSFETIIKNIVAEIDVDYLFDVFEKVKSIPITNYINLEPDVFNCQNFLTLMFQTGLLNFKF